jgi:hypothetical protein
VTLFRTISTMTLSEIRSVLRGTSTPSVSFSIKYGSSRSAAGTEVVTGGITTTDITTGLSTTSFTNATIPTGNYIWVVVSATSGNVDELNIELVF